MDKSRKIVKSLRRNKTVFCGSTDAGNNACEKQFGNTDRKRRCKDPHPTVNRMQRTASCNGRAWEGFMTIDPFKVKIFIRPGITDMRKAVNGLTVIVQEAMEQDPFNGTAGAS